MGKLFKFINSDNTEIIIDEEKIQYIDLHRLINGKYQIKATFINTKDSNDLETVISKIFETKNEAHRYIADNDITLNYFIDDKTGTQVLQLYMDFDIQQ